LKHPGIEYNSPTSFTLRQRIFLAIASRAIAWAHKAVVLTCKRDVRHRERAEAAQAEHGRFIIAMWHESLGLGLTIGQNTGWHTLTSYSFDGELAARVTHHFGAEAIRGSSSRGGMKALVELKKALQAGCTVGLTIDGPKGPRRQAKPGVALLAAHTGIPIIPIAATAQPAWRLKSWDHFLVPKPFGQLTYKFGAPIPAPTTRDAASVERTRQAVQDALDRLHAEIEEN